MENPLEFYPVRIVYEYGIWYIYDDINNCCLNLL